MFHSIDGIGRTTYARFVPYFWWIWVLCRDENARSISLLAQLTWKICRWRKLMQRKPFNSFFFLYFVYLFRGFQSATRPFCITMLSSDDGRWRFLWRKCLWMPNETINTLADFQYFGTRRTRNVQIVEMTDAPGIASSSRPCDFASIDAKSLLGTTTTKNADILHFQKQNQTEARIQKPFTIRMEKKILWN